MNIALCLCTRNRPEEIVSALSGAARSTLPPAQILVSDDSDNVEAGRIRGLCADAPGVTYLRGPRRGLSANRNHCLDHLAAAIEAVAYVDDDVVFRPDFLGDAAQALRCAPPRTIITGRENKAGFEVTPHNCSFWGHQEVPPKNEDDYHTIVINSALFPRTLFETVRFDEALRYGSEEADICAQAEAAGYRIRFSPALINDHYPSPVNRAEYAKLAEASRLYSTYKRYGRLERNRRKAALYALLAPLHLLGSAVKTRRPAESLSAAKAVWAALRLARHA